MNEEHMKLIKFIYHVFMINNIYLKMGLKTYNMVIKY